MLPREEYRTKAQKSGARREPTDAFPSWASGLEDMGLDGENQELLGALKDVPWNEMGFSDFSPLTALENMNSDEYKKVKAKLEALREREKEEKDTSKPLEEEPGGFALMLETTLDFFFLTPSLFTKPDGSFMFEPRKKDMARMAVILQSMTKGGGENKSSGNTLNSGGVGLGVGATERDFQPTLMFMPTAVPEGLLTHEGGAMVNSHNNSDGANPFIPAGGPSADARDPASGKLLVFQPQPSESTATKFKNKYKPHIPLGHKYIPKEEYTYDEAFSLCPVMTVSDGTDRGVQAWIKLPGISVPLHVSGMPCLCAGNMLFCIQRMYRMFGCKLPGGMQWNNMVLRLEGTGKPFDALDDLIPEEERKVNGSSDELHLDTSEIGINIDKIPTFVLEPKNCSLTVFVTNAPQPLILGQQPKLRKQRKNSANNSDDDEEGSDAEEFYNSLLQSQKTLPSDWKKQLKNYIPQRQVKQVVLEDLPKNFTIKDLKIAISTSANLELTPLEACACDLWVEKREEISTVNLEPTEGEDDIIAQVREKLLSIAVKYNKSLPALQGPQRQQQATTEQEPDLRKLPAEALAPTSTASFSWKYVDLPNNTPLWKLDFDGRGTEFNVFELQFDINVVGNKTAEVIEKGQEEEFMNGTNNTDEDRPQKRLVRKTEYGIGVVTGPMVSQAIAERQRKKMQQLSFQKARDSGLLNSYIAEMEAKRNSGGYCSTRMLIIYMIVYIVAIVGWYFSKSKKGDDKAGEMKDVMKNIYGKKFD